MLENAISSNLHSRDLAVDERFYFLFSWLKMEWLAPIMAASLVMITSKNYLLKFNFTFLLLKKNVIGK